MSERDYLYHQGFLDKKICHHLAHVYQQNPQLYLHQEEAFWTDRLLDPEGVKAADPLLFTAILYALGAAIFAIRQFYGIKTPLYADVLNIVGWAQGRSMPLHADNAYPDGRPHALAHRLYSGVIYLTEDYEGGELFIQRDGFGLVEYLHPPAGTLVSMPCGLSHMHGVREVTSGLRVALTFFLTDDPQREAREIRGHLS
jgi:hypothetical protein